LTGVKTTRKFGRRLISREPSLRRRIHPHDLPDIAVRVLDAVVEHEAMVLHRIGIGAAACRDCAGFDVRMAK
jgi:hypothetical protein